MEGRDRVDRYRWEEGWGAKSRRRRGMERGVRI